MQYQSPSQTQEIFSSTCIHTEITRLPPTIRNFGFHWSQGCIEDGQVENRHTQLPYLLKQLWATHSLSEKFESNGFLGAIFKSDPETGSPRRQKALLEKIDLLFLDYDKGDTSSLLQQWLDDTLLPDTCAVLHSTFSDGTPNPDCEEIQTRFRAILPLSRSITHEEYKRLTNHLAAHLGEIDPASFRPTQLMLGPRSNPASTRGPWLRVRPGALLDVDALLAQAPAHTMAPRSAARPFQRASKASSRPTTSARHDEDARRHYAESAMEQELSTLFRAIKGERNDQLNKSAFALGQLVAGNYLCEADVEARLCECAELIGLGHTERMATIQSGLMAGLREPRDLSHVISARTLSLEELPDELKAPLQRSPERYMPMPKIRPGVRLLALKGSLGSGKTRLVVVISKGKAKVVAYSPRVTLTRQLHHRYHADDQLEFTHYQDIDSYTIYDDKCVTCINSGARMHLGQIGEAPISRDLIFIDEIEQCIPALFSSKLRKSGESGQLYESLKTQCQHAELVILADAFLSQSSIDITARMMGLTKDQIQVVEHEYIDPNLRFVMADKQSDLEKQTFAMLKEGKRLAVACTAKSDVLTLETRIKKRFPNLRVLAIHADCDEEARATLTNVNESWNQFDVVLYSPTVSSGVSFDLRDHFDHIVVFAKSIDGIGYNDVLQQTFRCRHPKNQTVYIWLESKVFRRTTDREMVRQEALTKIEATHRFLTERPGIATKIENGKMARSPINPEHFEAWLDQEIELRKRCNNVKGCFLAYCETREIPTEDLEQASQSTKKELNEERKKTKQQLEQEKHQAILHAEKITIEEARLLEQKHNATREEKLSCRRARLEDLFGRIDLDLISRCEGSERLELSIRRITKAALWLSGEKGESYFIERDRHELETGFDLHLHHHATTHQWLGRLLEVLERTIPALPLKRLLELFSPLSQMKDTSEAIANMEPIEWHFTPEMEERLERELLTIFENEEGRAILKELKGLSLSPDNAKQQVGSLLAYLGLRKRRNQRRVDGTTVWFHTLDLDALEELYGLTKRYREQLLARVEDLATLGGEPERAKVAVNVIPPRSSSLKETLSGGVTPSPHWDATPIDGSIPVPSALTSGGVTPIPDEVGCSVNGESMIALGSTTEDLVTLGGEPERAKVAVNVIPPRSSSLKETLSGGVTASSHWDTTPIDGSIPALSNNSLGGVTPGHPAIDEQSLVDRNRETGLELTEAFETLETLASSLSEEKHEELQTLGRFFIEQWRESRQRGERYFPRLQGVWEHYFPGLSLSWVGKIWWGLRPVLDGL